MFSSPEWSRSTLGYKPGPQYRQILEQLLATLDQIISDRAEAETFC